jgi:hypothetical protein
MSTLRIRGRLAIGAAALSALVLVADAATAEATPSGTTHRLELEAGAERHRFTLRRPAGVVLLFRLTLPRGTRAYLTGRIGNVAGVGISTDHNASCRERGRFLVCEQGVEWCPLPRGTWGFRLHKVSGPAGQARLEFVVGTPPS